MFDYHVALIISKKPIDLSSFKEDDKAVQHFIQEKFHLDLNPGDEGWLINHDASKYAKYPFRFEATGSTVSVVIINWLRGLVCSFEYEPTYKKHKR